jgi:anaerobic selenocysteine-containing dehydrogenase
MKKPYTVGEDETMEESSYVEEQQEAAGFSAKSAGVLRGIASIPGATDDRPWSWQEGEYTVVRGNARTAPGCHDNCGILMYVKDGRVVKIEGDEKDPYNQGRLCLRCLTLPDTLYHKDRQLYPMKRSRADRGKDRWERISWDEALDLCVMGIKEVQAKYGQECVYVVNGTGRDVIVYENMLAGAMGTPNTGMGFFPGQSCYIPRTFSTNLKGGVFFEGDYSQFFPDRYENPKWQRPDYVFIWGNNPVVANSDGNLGHWIVECMKRGTKLITADPKLTWCAAHSEHWLQVRPGTDAALALAIGHVLIEEDLYDHEFVDCWTYGFEEYAKAVLEWTPARAATICQIDEDLIWDVARTLGTCESWVLQWGVAMDHTSEGFYTGMAAWDLVGLTGMFDHPGGMVAGIAPFNAGFAWIPSMDEVTWVTRPNNPNPNKKPPISYPNLIGLNAMGMPDAEALVCGMEQGDPYSIRACWFIATNVIANEGAEPGRILKVIQEVSEFNVVMDLWMTPTAMAAADVFLPVACFAERSGISGHQPYRIGAIVKAVEPAGEARSDQSIVLEICRRFAGEENVPFRTEEQMYDHLLQLGGSSLTYDFMREKGWAYPEVDYYRYKTGGLRGDGQPGFNTTTGRYEFFCLPLSQMGIAPLASYEEPPESPIRTPELAAEYPLILTTGARNWGFFHSEGRQIPHLRRVHPNPEVKLHPSDAKRAEIEDGDWVIIENLRGSCRQKAKVTIRIKEGVVSADHGWWFPERSREDGTYFGTLESNINNLLSLKPGRIGLGNSYKSCLCRVRKEENVGR